MYKQVSVISIVWASVTLTVGTSFAGLLSAFASLPFCEWEEIYRPGTEIKNRPFHSSFGLNLVIHLDRTIANYASYL